LPGHGPGRLPSTRDNFSAKIPAGASSEEFLLMLRNLLAELPDDGSFHQDTPQNPPPDSPSGPLKHDADGFPILPPGTILAISSDASGLTGKHDFVLSWS